MFLNEASTSEVSHMYTKENPLDLVKLHFLKTLNTKNVQQNCFTESGFLPFKLSLTLALPLECSPVTLMTTSKNQNQNRKWHIKKMNDYKNGSTCFTIRIFIQNQMEKLSNTFRGLQSLGDFVRPINTH